MTEWFTSDTHFGHANVITYCNRPFSSAEEMDEDLIRRWNTVVCPGDRVYILGDFALCKRPRRLEILQRLFGVKVLVRGNHDGDAKDCSKDFDLVCERMTLRLAKKLNVLLCHFPYTPTDERHPDKMPKDQGSWLLHGHVHCAWKKNGRQINVGSDVWAFAPVSKDEILRLIQKPD